MDRKNKKCAKKAESYNNTKGNNGLLRNISLVFILKQGDCFWEPVQS